MLVLAMYIVALLLATVFVAYLMGGWILDRFNRPQARPMARMLVGVLALSFLVSLPWVGWVIQLLVVIIGLGALMLERRSFRHELRTTGLA